MTDLYQDIPTRKFLPTLERREPIIMDHTATKLFKECPRKYFYRIVCGYKLEKGEMEDIFMWGNTIHKFAELYYQDGLFEPAMLKVLAMYKMPKPGTKWDFLSPSRLMQTVKLLKEFIDKERSRDDVEVLGIEQPFNVTLSDGTRIGGRFDLLLRRGNMLIVRDWKTTTQQTKWFQLTLDPNDQATRYAFSASILAGWSHENLVGNKVEAIEFVVMENPKPTKSDTKGPSLTTVVVPKTAQDLLGWERDQIQVYKMMALCRQLDVWPMFENSCKFCDYSSVCRSRTDGSREWKLKQDYVRSFWDHQKVTQEVEEG